MQLNINHMQMKQDLSNHQEQKKMTYQAVKVIKYKRFDESKLDDINSKMEEDEKQAEDGNEDDHKPAARVKSHDDDDVSDYEEEPSKKKRRKESFSLGCEVLDSIWSFIKKVILLISKKGSYYRKPRKPRSIRREYQQTVDANQDLHQRYQAEYGIHALFETMPMRLGEL